MGTKKSQKPRKTDIVTGRLLRALDWETVSEIMGEPGKKSERHLAIPIAENIVLTHCKANSSDARWAMEIDGIAQVREDYVRLDLAHPQCLEMTGQSMREIIDHPAFEGVMIEKVSRTTKANRRSGVVFKLKSEKSLLLEEQWEIDESMKVPAIVNPKYAGLCRLKAMPTAIRILETTGVNFEVFQRAYEEAGKNPYPDNFTEHLDLYRAKVPRGLKDLQPRAIHGVMRFYSLAVAPIGQESVIFDALEDHSRITFPFRKKIPLAMVIGQVGRDVADVIEGWPYGRGSIISSASLDADRMVLEIHEDPIALPNEGKAFVSKEEPYEGALTFADGTAFENLKYLVKRTHRIATDKPSPDCLDHLDVQVISIRENNGRTIALKMRRAGLKQYFAKRFGFTVDDEGWWICPLKYLRYDVWEMIAGSSITVGIPGKILIHWRNEEIYNLKIQQQL